MIGAIVGDIVGSRFEFENYKSKDFDLFGENSCSKWKPSFTDDTVMTVAVADAFLHLADRKDARQFQKSLIKLFHEYGARYSGAGYGTMLSEWLEKKRTAPYFNCGNESATRVSPCGWFGESLDECIHFAKLSAEITHNHPEEIKGAEAVSAAIYLARNKKTKNEIKAYIERHFYPDAYRQILDDLRNHNLFNETCQQTVPLALMAFHESVSFSDAVRNAVSLDGDSDKIACIAGAVAEAFYRVSSFIRMQTFSFWTVICWR